MSSVCLSQVFCFFTGISVFWQVVLPVVKGYCDKISYCRFYGDLVQGLTNPSFSLLPGIPQHVENGSELQYSLYLLYIFSGQVQVK